MLEPIVAGILLTWVPTWSTEPYTFSTATITSCMAPETTFRTRWSKLDMARSSFAILRSSKSLSNVSKPSGSRSRVHSGFLLHIQNGRISIRTNTRSISSMQKVLKLNELLHSLYWNAGWREQDGRDVGGHKLCNGFFPSVITCEVKKSKKTLTMRHNSTNPDAKIPFIDSSIIYLEQLPFWSSVLPIHRSLCSTVSLIRGIVWVCKIIFTVPRASNEGKMRKN